MKSDINKVYSESIYLYIVRLSIHLIMYCKFVNDNYGESHLTQLIFYNSILLNNYFFSCNKKFLISKFSRLCNVFKKNIFLINCYTHKKFNNIVLLPTV